jgi:hypothetical protein
MTFSGAALGPMIRPLDFGALMSSHDSTHADLARTVDDLVQWLHVVETGLTTVLDKSAADTTERIAGFANDTSGDAAHDINVEQPEKERDIIQRANESKTSEGFDADDFFDSSRSHKGELRAGAFEQFLDLESDATHEEDDNSDFSSEGHEGLDLAIDNPVNLIRSQLAARP